MFSNVSDTLNIHGIDKTSDGLITVNFDSTVFQITAPKQLSIQSVIENSTDNSITNTNLDNDDNSIIKTYPYFLAHPYKRALEENDAFKRLHLLKECF